jgi:hypothetical protein
VVEDTEAMVQTEPKLSGAAIHDIEHGSPKVFGSCIKNVEFTFRSPLSAANRESATSKHAVNKQTSSLKRPKGHPDGPSPPSSPDKKRVRDTSVNLHPSVPALVLPIVPPQIHIDTTSDIFGPVDEKLPLKRGRNVKLETFFKVETAEAKLERTTRDFEGIAARREEQEFNDAHALTLRQARRHQGDRERQHKHRQASRERKIAAGWLPNQKRVSLSIDVKP